MYVHIKITGKTVEIQDAYKIKEFDFSGMKKFDKKTGLDLNQV